MDTEDDFESWNMEELIQSLDPSDASIYLTNPDAAVDAVPMFNLEDRLILSAIVDLDSYIGNNDNNMAPVLSTPEPICAYPGVPQCSFSRDLDDPFIVKIPFDVTPAVASVLVGGLLQTPDSFTSRSRCASTSDIPDKTIKKKPRKRLASEADKRERRKESNRKAAGKYRQKQRETAKETQEVHARLMEENITLRQKLESLERELEKERSASRSHSLVCPIRWTEPVWFSQNIFDPDT